MNRTCCVLAMCASLMLAGTALPQDDAAACGRKAVQAGVGAGNVNNFVADCIAEMKAAGQSHDHKVEKDEKDKQEKKSERQTKDRKHESEKQGKKKRKGKKT